MNRKWFVWLSAFSFVIYAMHVPLVAFLINGMFQWLNFVEGYRLITFVALPLMIIAWCIALGLLLRSITPKLYGVLTGGRGV
jgi:peptidoglycan/LPS O-acetylase OafA/YrhL